MTTGTGPVSTTSIVYEAASASFTSDGANASSKPSVGACSGPRDHRGRRSGLARPPPPRRCQGGAQAAPPLPGLRSPRSDDGSSPTGGTEIVEASPELVFEFWPLHRLDDGRERQPDVFVSDRTSAHRLI